MKILVSGGAGFIGSHIADAYIEAGHDVVVVDNLSTGRRPNLNPKARFYHADITDAEAIGSLMEKEKPDVINHHAAHVDVRRSMQQPVFDATENVIGSLTLIEASLRCGAAKFIFASTGGAVYGEPDRIPVDEDYPPNPLCPYGVSKLAIEHYLPILAGTGPMKWTILRYPNVYGPRQNPRGEAGVVAIFSTQMLKGIQPVIFGDGTKTRDYVFVLDLVKASVLALDRGDSLTCNLGWGKEVTDFEIFDAVRGALNASIDPEYSSKRPGEVDRIALNTERIKKELGWVPTISLKEGVGRTVEYYRETLKQWG